MKSNSGKKNLIVICFVLIIALPFGFSTHADIYIWIDANGQKQFTNTLPPEGVK